MLYARGVFINRCFDELNISSPDMVRQIHQEYVKAGAEILETNTFGANRMRLGRWQLFQLISFAGGQDQNNSEKKRFTIFPLYFQQRSPRTNDNYTAVVPIYGHIQDQLMRDKIFFVMFPIYSQTQKRDVVTDNYLFPIFDVQHGDGLHGWQFWPLLVPVTRS